MYCYVVYSKIEFNNFNAEINIPRMVLHIPPELTSSLCAVESLPLRQVR